VQRCPLHQYLYPSYLPARDDEIDTQFAVYVLVAVQAVKRADADSRCAFLAPLSTLRDLHLIEMGLGPEDMAADC
jgi:hypothetical protein